MLEINKIHLGDSYELIKEIPDNSVDCVYVDIPYLSTFTGGDTLKHKLGKYIKEEVESFSNGINYGILNEFIRVMKNINCFIWCSKNQLLEIMNFFNKYNADMNLLVWTKTNPIPFGSSIWLSDVEYCLHFYKDSKFNVGWENKHKSYTSAINNKDKELFNHPTIKPLEFVKKHLLNMTQEGDMVFDCFAGSGTTCVAAKELKRNFIGIEIDPKWHKIACDRLENIDANGQLSLFAR